MNDKLKILADVPDEFLLVFRWILSGIIQALFIALWVLVQWSVNKYIITQFQVGGTDKNVLFIAQWLFAIATLIPMLLFLVKLLVTMTLRTYREIRQEFQKESN